MSYQWLPQDEAKKLAKDLRKSGNFAAVKLGASFTDSGIRYSKVYARLKERTEGVLE